VQSESRAAAFFLRRNNHLGAAQRTMMRVSRLCRRAREILDCHGRPLPRAGQPHERSACLVQYDLPNSPRTAGQDYAAAAIPQTQDRPAPQRHVAARRRISIRDRESLRRAGLPVRALSKTSARSPGELEITLSISNVAVCCSRASFSSRLRSSSCFRRLAAEELRRRMAFGALRRFSVIILRRRVLAGSPPALERRLIAATEAQDKAS
jgi:hypothetical protein